jgi:hypothetical protein
MEPRPSSARLRSYLLSDDYMLRVLPLVQERIDTLEGFFEYGYFFFAGEVAYDAAAMKQLVPRGRTARGDGEGAAAPAGGADRPAAGMGGGGPSKARCAPFADGRGLGGQGRLHDRAAWPPPDARPLRPC